MKNGLILVISGPSGVGKGTVIAEVMKQEPRARFSVSATTRAPRPGEIDGVSYHYITKEQFEDNIKNHRMAEYTCYNGNYYGTPKSSIEDVISKGDHVILDIEVEGASNIKAIYPQCKTIFILPPDEATLRARLEGRHTETAEQVEGRLNRAKEELKQAPHYDYRVTNTTVEQCAKEILDIMRKEEASALCNG